MSGFLIVVGVLGLLYGWRRPDGALPSALGAPSRAKVLALYGGMGLAGVTMAGGTEPDSSPVGAWDASADSSAAATASPPTDPWPARDSALTALAALVEAGDYAEAADEARRHASEPYARAVADSLLDVAGELEAYGRARQLPGRDLQGNRDAYAALATRYPSSPRAAAYAEKRADYDQRIIDAEAVRYRALYAPRPARGGGGAGSGCCKRCSAGQPCGNSCISRSYTCHQPPGCAC